jgi:3-methyladenine DNA glycosylase AlkC
MDTPTARKGARSIKDIPADILTRLNHGDIESANLVEWLAVDQRALLTSVLNNLGYEQLLNPIITELDKLPKQTTPLVASTIGSALGISIAQSGDNGLLSKLQSHKSDMVRCWACYIVCSPGSDLDIMFENLKPLADDTHFGVREIAWMAARPYIINSLDASLKILTTWAADPSANIRRFASESTRPRGVWSAHINELKTNPERALSLIECLKNDSSKYVQDSVGNWLNDAGKTSPAFVRDMCLQWQTESPNPTTSYIIKKALRNLR